MIPQYAPSQSGDAKTDCLSGEKDKQKASPKLSPTDSVRQKHNWYPSW